MEPYERLDQAMNRRRLELRLNWRELADAAGISYTALRAIRRGDYRPTELTARALDEALQWELGSVQAVLNGDEPTPLGARPSTPATQSFEAGLSSREQGILAEMVASTAEGFDLTPEQLDAAYRRAVELIKERQAARGVDGKEARKDRAS